MAVTVKHKDGKADLTPSPTGMQSGIVYGPPVSGNPFTKGVYIKQDATTYRWIEDLQTPGTAAPGTWMYL